MFCKCIWKTLENTNVPAESVSAWSRQGCSNQSRQKGRQQSPRSSSTCPAVALSCTGAGPWLSSGADPAAPSDPSTGTCWNITLSFQQSPLGQHCCPGWVWVLAVPPWGCAVLRAPSQPLQGLGFLFWLCWHCPGARAQEELVLHPCSGSECC